MKEINKLPTKYQKRKQNPNYPNNIKMRQHKEQEVSNKETSMAFDARNINHFFECKGCRYMSGRDYRIHNF